MKSRYKNNTLKQSQHASVLKLFFAKFSSLYKWCGEKRVKSFSLDSLPCLLQGASATRSLSPYPLVKNFKYVEITLSAISFDKSSPCPQCIVL